MAITFTLKDKTNYGWQNAFGTAQEGADVVLEWNIIDSPLAMTLNEQELSASQFEALTQFNIGDNWYVTVSEGYNYSLNYEYVNANNNKVWSGETNEGEGSGVDVTVNPSDFTYLIKITQNAQVVYTKTITVNHDVFENVMVGDTQMTFEEFIANPKVEYGKTLTFNLKAEYVDIFNFSQNGITVTDDVTISITYQLLDTRVYKTIDVLCLIEPIENITVGSQTLSYEEFTANPVVKYGDTLSVNFKNDLNGFYTDFSFPYTVTDDMQIKIYKPTGEIFDTIYVECKNDVLTNILLNDESLTFQQLLQMNKIYLGSTLTFTVNEEFENLVQVTRNGQTLTGQQTITVDDMNSLHLDIQQSQTFILLDSIHLNSILFDNIEINDRVIDTTQSTYIDYNRDLNENDFTISFDSSLMNQYDFYYQTSLSFTNVAITQPSFEIAIDEIQEYLYIYVVYNDDALQVLTIYFKDFCPVETVTANIYQQNSIDNSQFQVYNDEINITSYGAINGLNITFNDDYADCTYKIFDESGIEVEDFTTIQNKVYTAKIYSGESEIYSFIIKVKYQFNNLIEGMQYLGNSNVASIVTNSSQLKVPNLTDTGNYTNQSITFNNGNSVTLTEGQQTVKVVYSFIANQKTYKYTFDLIVEYVPEEQIPKQYVSNISITAKTQGGSEYNIDFDSNLAFADGEYELADLAFVQEDNIFIDTYGYTVVSKEIKFSNDKTLCWLEYVISVDGQNKTFRAYIKTTGTISNNTNAQVIFTDAKVNQDITDLFVDNTYEIEVVNVFGDLDIVLDDNKARVEYYFGENSVDSRDFQLNAVGTYKIKITSSDNTTTRELIIKVKSYINLMFEVFYGNERLYLEYSNQGPIGNMKMKYDPLTGPYFIGYFGYADLSNMTQVAISGSSAYEGMLYYSDKETPITNLDNLLLKIMIDTDGSITQIVGAKYVLVYAKILNADYAVYFIFENRPPYPMNFIFDTNNNDEIDDKDKQLAFKVNVDEVLTGIVDLGDFIKDNSGAIVEVTREEMGMAEGETSVEVVVTWQSTFDDYRYQYFTSLPEDGSTPALVGPSENNLTSTLTLNFVDNGSGKYIATIYVCAEGATQDTLIELAVPVSFILVA